MYDPLCTAALLFWCGNSQKKLASMIHSTMRHFYVNFFSVHLIGVTSAYHFIPLGGERFIPLCFVKFQPHLSKRCSFWRKSPRVHDVSHALSVGRAETKKKEVKSIANEFCRVEKWFFRLSIELFRFDCSSVGRKCVCSVRGAFPIAVDCVI